MNNMTFNVRMLASVLCASGAMQQARAGDTFGPVGSASSYLPASAFQNRGSSACSMELSTIDYYFFQTMAGRQAEPAVEQTWEPIHKQEVALPIRTMPVPDAALIYEMAAADAAAAEQ